MKMKNMAQDIFPIFHVFHGLLIATQMKSYDNEILRTLEGCHEIEGNIKLKVKMDERFFKGTVQPKRQILS